MAEDRFIRLKSGAVYRYAEKLAKRKDSQIVDGYAAANYFRSVGVENDITKKYQERPIDKSAPPRKAPSSRGKKRSESAKPPVIVTDDPEIPAELENLDDDVENLLSGN